MLYFHIDMYTCVTLFVCVCMLMRWCCLLIIMIFGHARDIVYNVQFAMKKERERGERESSRTKEI